MHTKSHAPFTRVLVATLVVATLAVAVIGCSSKNKMVGTYVGVPGNSVFTKVELQAGGKAVFTLVGISHEASYTVNGSTVVVKNEAGELHELKIDSKGCLVDAIGGTYCRN